LELPSPGRISAYFPASASTFPVSSINASFSSASALAYRATYRDGGKYGVMDETGKKLTEAVYDNIETYGSLLGK